jgi:hypothetical protein
MKETLAAWASELTCPACGSAGMHIDWRMKPKKIGTYSVAGSGVNLAVEETPWLVCDSCGVEAEGHK